MFEYKNTHCEAVQLSVMHYIDEMLVEVDKLWQRTNSRFELRSLYDYYVQLEGFSMTEEFVRHAKDFALEWAIMLNKYMEIYHYLMRYQYIQISDSLPSERTLARLRHLDDEHSAFLRTLIDYLSNLPPSVTENIQAGITDEIEQSGRSIDMLPSHLPFERFGIYLRGIEEEIHQIRVTGDNPEGILHGVKGIMRKFFLLFMDALRALEKFREDLMNIRNALDDKMNPFVMGMHHRLGGGSHVLSLSPDILSMIRDLLDVDGLD